MEKPSIILPKKRLRFSSEKMKPGIVVKVTGLNVVKRMSEVENQKVFEFMKRFPGEFYKVEYWKDALERGIGVEASAEALRLGWMSSQGEKEKGKGTEFWLRVAESGVGGVEESDDKEIVEVDKQDELLVLCAEGGRKIFSKLKAENKFFNEGLSKKFETLLKTCNKLSKKQYTPAELCKLLSQFKGKSTDLINFIINQSSNLNILSIYEDCCNLSHTKIPYQSFLSKYLSLSGAITSLYNHYASKKP